MHKIYEIGKSCLHTKMVHRPIAIPHGLSWLKVVYLTRIDVCVLTERYGTMVL